MKEKKEITVAAVVERLKTVIQFLDEILRKQECPASLRMKLEVVLEEMFVNVASYAYPDEPGECTVMVETETICDRTTVTITVKDKGTRFNPMEKENPDITLPLEERPVGGLGIYMTRQTMDQMQYHYENGENILTMTKVWE